MVQSVAAVPSIGKVKRDHQNNSHSGNGGKNSSGGFAQVLADAREETRKTSMDCHTTTYGRDRQIRTFIYQSGEYHF
ncbi:MAG: hypothetical protein K2O16_11520 [Lachnospiraceae bacterium]|nr:hypothetical protein [Lachnospiraceae bacterium]